MVSVKSYFTKKNSNGQNPPYKYQTILYSDPYSNNKVCLIHVHISFSSFLWLKTGQRFDIPISDKTFFFWSPVLQKNKSWRNISGKTKTNATFLGFFILNLLKYFFFQNDAGALSSDSISGKTEFKLTGTMLISLDRCIISFMFLV